MVFPVINDPKTTTADTYGGDVMTTVQWILSGYDIAESDPTNIVSIATEFRYWWGKLNLWDSTQTKVLTFNTPSLVNDVFVGFPDGLLSKPSANHFLFENVPQTITAKQINAVNNTITNIKNINIASDALIAWSKISKVGAGLGDIPTVNLDGLADGVVLAWSVADNEWFCTIPAGGGDIVGGTNQGSGVGVFKDKSSGLLNFKTFLVATGSRLSISGSTNNVTFDVNESNLNLANMGGSLPWAKLLKTGSILTDIGDVDTAGISDGQSLRWQSSNSLWIPYTPATGTGGDVYQANANIFTALQTVKANLQEVLTLYRNANTVNNNVGIKFDHNNAAGTPIQVTYGEALVSVEANTASAHRGNFHILLALAGAVAERFRIYTSGTNGGIMFGNDLRAVFDAAGLSAARTYGVPNFDTMLAGLAGAQTFTGLKSFDEEVLLKESTAANVANSTSGYQALYIDSTSHKLSRKDSSGNITLIETPASTLDPTEMSFLPSTKKAGWSYPAGSGGNATHQSLLTSAVDAGTQTTIWDSVEGTCLECDTGTTSNSNAGLISPSSGGGIGRRSAIGNLRMKTRTKINSTSNSRFYAGFTSNTTLPKSDTPLGSGDSGVIVGFRSSDANWSIFRNDGTTGMQITNTGIPKDTVFRTFEIIYNGTTDVTVYINGVAQTPFTTILPSTSVNQYLNVVGQNTGSTAKQMTYTYIECQGN